MNRSIASLLFTLRVFLTNLSEFYVKDLLPYTHFYMALYYRFSDKSGTSLYTSCFFVKIDHDDGTVNTDYAMRKLDMNHIDWNLIYRHRDSYCINCVLVI